jgi:hypothetical protein
MSQIRKILGFLKWPVRSDYYMESLGGRFVISEARIEGGCVFHAHLRNETHSISPHGSLGVYDSLDGAVASCEDFEINLQANHINGKYYGSGI